MQKRLLHQVCICAHKICKSDDKYAYCVAYMQKGSVDMQVAGFICIIYRSNRCYFKKENELSTENEYQILRATAINDN